MTAEESRIKLEKLLTPRRFNHSLGVMDTALDLARRYGADTEKAVLAGLLHDCARDVRGDAVFHMCARYGIEVDEVSRHQPELLHGPIGACMLVDEFGLDDMEIRQAIRFHTTGFAGMGLLDKIVFVADYVEPGRSFPGVDELRKEAFISLDGAMLMILDRTIGHVLAKGALLHPDTVGARNWLLLERLYKGKKDTSQ